jgi:hypothetical protein
MIASVLHPVLAGVNNVHGGGPLTLVFPLVLVPIIAAIWVAWWMRRSRNYP